MAKVGDRIEVEFEGPGTVIEVLGLGCLMVQFDSWPEPCQIHERMIITPKTED